MSANVGSKTSWASTSSAFDRLGGIKILSCCSGRPQKPGCDPGLFRPVTIDRDGSTTSAARAAEAANPGVQHLIAVGSGKGGVGKTTVSVNLAISLAPMGRKVGLLDADVYGPNVPLMMGTQETPRWATPIASGPSRNTA